MKLLSILLLLAVILSPPSSLSADPIKTNNAKYIDLDGDGFNDNMQDINNDGIPDLGGTTVAKKQTDAVTAMGTGIFTKMEAAPVNLSLFTANSLRFSSLKCCTLSLLKTRGGFGAEDDFGPAVGSNQGSGGGGNCSGGICH